MAIDATILGEMFVRLGQAGSRRQRADTLRYYSRLCGVSVAQLRRHAKHAGVDFGYAQRSDAGQARNEEFATAADIVASMIIKSHGDMPTWVAIDRCIKIGSIPADLELPVYYVDRYMRTHGLARKPSKTPVSTRRCKWGEVGDTIQIDSTNCQQWFFVEPDGSIRYTRTGEVYRNKPAKSKPIIRYVATDPTSGMFRIRYYLTDGESAEVTLQFLYHIMSRAEHPDKMPMGGVPKVLMMDKGPGNTSAAVKNLCAELGMDHRTHATGHSHAKGSVEEAMILWQRSFESELRLWPADSIDELNERAYLANIEFCAKRKHTRTSQPRSAFYAEHIGEITLPPTWELFVEAATTTRVRRRIRGGHLISFEGRDYYVGGLEGVKTGDRVEVAKAVLAWDDATLPIRIYHDDQCIVENALIKDDRGNYTDQRVYEQRTDAVLDAQQQDREVRLASEIPTEAPKPQIAAIKSFKIPTAKLVVRPAQAGPTYRRTPALLKLAEQIGRELSRFEVNGLGWGKAVTQQQIETAAAMLKGDTTKAGTEPGQAAAG